MKEPSKDCRNTALLTAAERGDMKHAQAIVAKGANNLPEAHMIAKSKKHRELAKWLKNAMFSSAACKLKKMR
jgi:hypothetical protein